MKTRWRDNSPAVLSLLFVIISEFISIKNPMSADQQKHFQTISNLILLTIGSYGFLFIGFPLKNKPSGALLRFFSNALVVVAAYILNINVFLNIIQQTHDLFAGWHILWLIWSVVLILALILSEPCRIIYHWTAKTLLNTFQKSWQCFQWVENTVKKCHKGTLFSSVTGFLLCLSFFMYEYVGRGYTLENSFLNTIFLCILWIVICTLFALFGSIFPKISKGINRIDDIKILKYTTVFITTSIILFTAHLIFPLISGIVGIIFSFLVSMTLIIAAAVYTGKKFSQYFSGYAINWQDVYFFIVALLFITVILIPCIGLLTEDRARILASGSPQYLIQIFFELFGAGLNMMKTFIFNS